MSYDYDESYEGDDYEEERPRDDKIDDAKARLRVELFADDNEAVFYQRQIETRYERDFFHWITAKALNELAAEGFFSSSLVPLIGKANIRFYWWPRNRYWKRQANAIKKLVLTFSESDMSHAIGRQGEMMFDAALPRIGFLPAAPYKNVKVFGGKSWIETKHDLDRVFTCDGINYGIEIKNTLSYIERSELEIKLRMCKFLNLRPLFIMRMAPKSYMHVIQQLGGFGLLFGKQLYPYGSNELAKQVQGELQLPVECAREVADGHLQRLKNWHDSLVKRLARKSQSKATCIQGAMKNSFENKYLASCRCELSLQFTRFLWRASGDAVVATGDRAGSDGDGLRRGLGLQGRADSRRRAVPAQRR